MIIPWYSKNGIINYIIDVLNIEWIIISITIKPYNNFYYVRWMANEDSTCSCFIFEAFVAFTRRTNQSSRFGRMRLAWRRTFRVIAYFVIMKYHRCSCRILFNYIILCSYRYKRLLLINSHSQDFLNNVCTNIIYLNKKKLNYYTGNYDAFIKTRLELLENQAKRFNWEQAQIKHMKE